MRAGRACVQAHAPTIITLIFRLGAMQSIPSLAHIGMMPSARGRSWAGARRGSSGDASPYSVWISLRMRSLGERGGSALRLGSAGEPADGFPDRGGERRQPESDMR
eukprot:scaffold48845_cov37-Tisochrysis_lutea.AAC.4